MIVRMRRFLAILTAVLHLLVQFFFCVTLSLATGWFAFVIYHEARDLRMTPLQLLVALCGGEHSRDRPFRIWLTIDNGYIYLTIFVLVSFIAGVWLSAGLAHWRWQRRLLGWVGLVGSIIWFNTLTWPLTWLLEKLSGQNPRYDGPDLEQSAQYAVVFGVSLLFTFAGMPAGGALARLAPRNRRRRFIRKLAKHRKRRRSE